MADQKRFDMIIAGAGAAGLSLLWRLMEAHAHRNQHILLIDHSFEPHNDKTWCYWENLELPESNLIYHSWKKLQVHINGEIFSDTLNRYQYHCLRSGDFKKSILNSAEKNKNVSLIEAEILGFSGDEYRGIVHTSKGQFTANHVFQSVKKPQKFDELKVDISLIQHFLGLEIETEDDLFDPGTATFMDFDVPQKNGITFMYLLPFSKKRALVEYTIFSKEMLDRGQYKQEITKYLRNNYQLGKNKYKIKREEFGVIPMEDRKYPSWYCRNVLNIGTVSGIAKPSTGYTFSRIQKHSEEIVKALENGNKLPEGQFSSYRFRVYDFMMLYLLDRETENSLQVFHKLFSKYSFDLVLQFLAEETNPLQELSIFSGMPYVPFFRSIYYMKNRLFTGA